MNYKTFLQPKFGLPSKSTVIKCTLSSCLAIGAGANMLWNDKKKHSYKKKKNRFKAHWINNSAAHYSPSWLFLWRQGLCHHSPKHLQQCVSHRRFTTNICQKCHPDKSHMYNDLDIKMNSSHLSSYECTIFFP